MVFCIRKICGKSGAFIPGDIEARLHETEQRRGEYFYNPNITIKKTSLLQPKSLEDERSIRTAIEANDFINKIISKDVIDEVISAMNETEVSAGDNVVKEGDDGDHIFVSAEGRYQTIVKGKPVGEFEDVRVFGELAILYKAKRAATIKALTKGKLWVLTNDLFQQIRIRRNAKEEEEVMEFLSNNQILRVVGREALQVVANLLKPEVFAAGTEIIKQGDKGHKFYIIRAGTVTITKDGEGVVGLYKKGDSFGEYALLDEVRRQATVTADAPAVECLTLTRKEFIRYFGQVPDFKNLKLPPKNSVPGASPALPSEVADISLDDLAVITFLGEGSFGTVELVQHKKKKHLVFARKNLRKSMVVYKNQQEHVVYERDIQRNCKSAFIVELYRTLSDDVYLYFLMEPCMGGDLWNHMKRKKSGRLEETEAKFYFACVLEAIGYLHSKEIIYRDLKPENLVLCSNGYLKLADLRCAKKVPFQGKTNTFLGTPEYMAPEIVIQKAYNKAVDYWQCGVLVYDLLCGFSPFRCPDNNPLRVHRNILNGIERARFPTFINLVTSHLIFKLCEPVPTERLGMDENGIEAVKTHKWFSGFKWSQFKEFKMRPPFKPRLNGPLDNRYIEKCGKTTIVEMVQLDDVDVEWFDDWDT